MKTYGNSLTWSQYESEIFKGLKMSIGLQSMDTKASKMAKRYFNQGYPVTDAIGGIIAKY